MTGAEIVAAAKTAAKVAKGVQKVAQKIQKLIDIDQRRRVIVKRDFIAGRIAGEIKGFPSGAVRSGVPDFRCPDFDITDGVVAIYATADRKPFCDGASLCPDKIGSFDLMAAALVHDAIYAYMETIATEWGWPEGDVRWLADELLKKSLHAEADRQKVSIFRAAGHLFADFAFAMVRAFGGVYHKNKQEG